MKTKRKIFYLILMMSISTLSYAEINLDNADLNRLTSCDSVEFSFRRLNNAGDIRLVKANSLDDYYSEESMYLLKPGPKGRGSFPLTALDNNSAYVLRAVSASGSVIEESRRFRVQKNPRCFQASVSNIRLLQGSSFQRLTFKYRNLPRISPKYSTDYHWAAVARIGAPNSKYLDIANFPKNSLKGDMIINLKKASYLKNLELRLYYNWRKGIQNYRVAKRIPLKSKNFPVFTLISESTKKYSALTEITRNIDLEEQCISQNAENKKLGLAKLLNANCKNMKAAILPIFSPVNSANFHRKVYAFDLNNRVTLEHVQTGVHRKASRAAAFALAECRNVISRNLALYQDIVVASCSENYHVENVWNSTNTAIKGYRIELTPVLYLE